MEKSAVLTTVKSILPTRFLLKDEAGDTPLNTYLDMVLTDINIHPPGTSYTFATAPAQWENVIVFGANVYATLFVYLGYTLKDFNWSDGGVTINPDRTGKLSSAHERLVKQFDRSVKFLKRLELLKISPKGVGSISYQMAAASPSNTLSGVVKTTYGINVYSPNVGNW